MNLINSVSTSPVHHSTYKCFVVAAMLLHAKIILYFNFEREGLCLQALRMRVNIPFGLLCWDDSVA